MVAPVQSELLSVCRVLILKADRFYADALRRVVSSALPAAQIEITGRVSDAVACAAVAPIDLLVTGMALLDGDVLEFLATSLAAGGNVRRAFIVTARREPRALANLRELRISGVFDSGAEGMEQFEAAIASVANGCGYWSQSILERIYGQKPAAMCRLLTRTEQRVFSAIGDGTDDKEAAAQLCMTQTSVHSVRRKLHRKLGIKHRGDLIRFAVLLGFVRFAYGGVQRPGYLPQQSGVAHCSAVNSAG